MDFTNTIVEEILDRGAEELYETYLRPKVRPYTVATCLVATQQFI